MIEELILSFWKRSWQYMEFNSAGVPLETGG